jgi:menaquinone-dependent protoporphyrinogen oxidase
MHGKVGGTVTAQYMTDVRPRVLVAYASRHGSTREIAAALARELIRSGSSATVAPVERRPEPTDYDAVVLGSAVYGGQWLGPAVRYACEMTDALRSRPTWLFSSGLAYESLRLPDEVPDARWFGEGLGARGHRVFGGRVERRLLSAEERRTWGSGRAGDFRNWPAVRAWSAEIAAEAAGLRTVAAVG